MKLSVIIPAHNEEKRIEQTLSSVNEYLSAQGFEYEVIVVDNGSTDKTDTVIEDLVRRGLKNVRVLKVHLPGKGATVKAGIEQAVGDFVMFMDADNATPISEIAKFWTHFDQGYSVVIGSRYLAGAQVTKKQPLYRIVLSRGANLLIQMVALPGIKDTQMGFKAFTRESAKKIFKFVRISGWGFDMEVLTIARVNGYRIKEVPVLWREFGGSHVPLKAYVQSLIDLGVIKIRALFGKYKETGASSFEG